MHVLMENNTQISFSKLIKNKNYFLKLKCKKIHSKILEETPCSNSLMSELRVVLEKSYKILTTIIMRIAVEVISYFDLFFLTRCEINSSYPVKQ